MKQAEIFVKSEGDAWYRRNKKVPRLPDMVLDAIEKAGIQPLRSAMELGCGDGWRLEALKKKWGCHCMGYDPSTLAVSEGKKRGLNLEVADAKEGLYFTKERFYDIIIFGFCLYLVDREDLQMIAGLADRALKNGGYIVIHDFIVKDHYRRSYKHKEGIWSYKMYYPNLWLGNPSYHEKYKKWKDSEEGVVILEKTLDIYPVRT